MKKMRQIIYLRLDLEEKTKHLVVQAKNIFGLNADKVL